MLINSEPLRIHAARFSAREIDRDKQRASISVFNIEEEQIALYHATSATVNPLVSPPHFDITPQLIDHYHHQTYWLPDNDLPAMLRHFEHLIVHQALRQTADNKSHAGDLLGINRNTIYDLLERARLAHPPHIPPHLALRPYRIALRSYPEMKTDLLRKVVHAASSEPAPAHSLNVTRHTWARLQQKYQ